MLMYVNLTDNPRSFFLFLFCFLVKRKLCSGLEKAQWLSTLLMLILFVLSLALLFIAISVRFMFHLFIDIFNIIDILIY